MTVFHPCGDIAHAEAITGSPAARTIPLWEMLGRNVVPLGVMRPEQVPTFATVQSWVSVAPLLAVHPAVEVSKSGLTLTVVNESQANVQYSSGTLSGGSVSHHSPWPHSSISAPSPSKKM